MIPINIYEKPKVLKTKTIALVLSFKVVDYGFTNLFL